jgi:hypothetical protein
VQRCACQVGTNNLAHSYMAFCTCYADTGLWGMYLTAEAGRLPELMQAVNREFVRLCDGITDEEVERAKIKVRSVTPACLRPLSCRSFNVPACLLLAPPRLLRKSFLLSGLLHRALLGDGHVSCCTRHGCQECFFFSPEIWGSNKRSISAHLQFKTQALMQLDGTTAVCEEIGRQLLCLGRRLDAQETEARIEAVDAAAVRAV